MVETAVNSKTAESSPIALEKVLPGVVTISERTNTETNQCPALKPEDGSLNVSKDGKEGSCDGETNTTLDQPQPHVETINEKPHFIPAQPEEHVKADVESEGKIQDFHAAKANNEPGIPAPTDEHIHPETKPEDEVQDTDLAKANIKSGIPAPMVEHIKPDIKPDDKSQEVDPAKSNAEPGTLAPTEEDIKPDMKSNDKIQDIYPTKANMKPRISDERNDKIEPPTIENMKIAAHGHIPFQPVRENPPPSRQEKVQAMHSLLLIIYRMPPVISSKDIDLALRQSEHLMKAAEVHCAVPLVRPYIGNVLLQFGPSVYHAILREPRRWLNLSIQLENAQIFREAMIHIVGTLPDKITAETLSGIIDGVRGLVQRKVTEVRQKMSMVNEALFSASIDYNGSRVRLDPHDKTYFDSWFVTQMWRSWFCDNLAECRIPSRHPSEPNIMTKLGMLYRIIAVGGDAYLPIHQVEEVLQNFTLPNFPDGTSCISGFLEWKEAALDLSLMKEFAQHKVQKICKNESMLTPEEGNFHYLTCISIESHELPWTVEPSH